MADPTPTYTAVDLSQLPAPDVVEVLDFETNYADFAARVQTKLPDFNALDETDPAVAVAQVAAYEIMLLRQRVNDGAKAVMVAYAQGADLDQVGANFGVRRLTLVPADPVNQIPAVMESDPDFRRRIILAPEAYSVAGPEGAYISMALAADPRVLDASATSPKQDDIRALVLQVLTANAAPAELVTAMTAALDGAIWPGTVTLSVLSRDGDGSAPADLIDAVDDYCSDQTRRPLTDHVVVQSAEIIPFEIVASITTFAGPDSSIVLANAQAAAQAYVDESFRLGRDITRAALFAAINGPGVQNTILTSPAADIVVDRTQAAQCTGITITYAGPGE